MSVTATKNPSNISGNSSILIFDEEESSKTSEKEDRIKETSKKIFSPLADEGKLDPSNSQELADLKSKKISNIQGNLSKVIAEEGEVTDDAMIDPSNTQKQAKVKIRYTRKNPDDLIEVSTEKEEEETDDAMIDPSNTQKQANVKTRNTSNNPDNLTEESTDEEEDSLSLNDSKAQKSALETCIYRFEPKGTKCAIGFSITFPTLLIGGIAVTVVGCRLYNFDTTWQVSGSLIIVVAFVFFLGCALLGTIAQRAREKG